MHPSLASLLKRRSAILSIIIVLPVLLGFGLALLAVRARPERTKIVGQINTQDVGEIREAISGVQLGIARECFRRKQYGRFFRFCYRDLLIGGAVEVRSHTGPDGETAQVQGPTASY